MRNIQRQTEFWGELCGEGWKRKEMFGSEGKGKNFQRPRIVKQIGEEGKGSYGS